MTWLPEDPACAAAEPFEPGPALEARIAEIETRTRAGVVGRDDVLMLIAMVRELLADRAGLLEEIDALEHLRHP